MCEFVAAPSVLRVREFPFPWPAYLSGLGEFGTGGDGALTTCADCPEGIHPAASATWVRYGGRPLCLPCARARAKADAA